jgi:hypothetical protein
MELMSSWSVLVALVYGVKNTIKKNTEALLQASMGVGPRVNAEKTKYMVIYRHQNAG